MCRHVGRLYTIPRTGSGWRVAFAAVKCRAGRAMGWHILLLRVVRTQLRNLGRAHLGDSLSRVSCKAGLTMRSSRPPNTRFHLSAAPRAAAA